MSDEQAEREATKVLMAYLNGEASENEAMAAVARVAGGPITRAQFRDVVAQAESMEAPSTHYIDPYIVPGDTPGGVDDSSDEVIVCDTCGELLNRFTSGDNEGVWVHPRPYATYDHEPVPRAKPRDDFRDTTCDFCGLKLPPHYRYVGERMRQRAINGGVHDYGTVWTACRECSELIDDGDMDGLLSRLQRVSPSRFTKGLSRDELASWRANVVETWLTFLRTVHDKIYAGPQREPTRLNPRMMPKLQLGLLKFWRDPGLQELYFQRRAENGQTHSLPGVHIGREDHFMVQIPPGDRVPDEAWTNHVQHLCAGIMGSELYWIAENFTQLAIMAGKDLTSLNLTRESLPSKFGFMVYDRAIGEIPRPNGAAGIRAVSWTLIPGGIWINLYVQGEDGDPDIDVVEMREQRGYLISLNSGSGLPFDTDGPPVEQVDDEKFGWIKTIYATWFLIGQPGVAESHPAPVDKKLARSYQRANGRRLPDVQLIDLRHQPRRAAPEVEGRPGRKLTVRVFRRGHWKQQAYGPKRGLRRPIYVSEYIAGPDGAPLKARGQTVKVLR
jgi:hypothetical protein